MKTIFSLFVGLLIATAAVAQDTIRIDLAASHSMVAGARVGDGYLVITNSGSEPDRLIAASSDRAKTVQLHQKSMDNSIMTMRELKGGLTIPAGQTVTLAPNHHLMFQDVEKPFKQGERIRVVLSFEKAGEITAYFAVGKIAGPLDDIGGASGMDHGGMDHGGRGHGAMNMPGKEGMDMSGPPPEEAIPETLKTMFERPDKPLTILPVVVEKDWAIAGWQQDGRGGRALLKKGHHGWNVFLCSGDGIRQAAALEKAGLSIGDAKALAADLAEAESKLDPKVLALFASFEGTVMMAGEAGDAGQAGHEAHGQ
ncbi:copper uptake system-associated protein [Rhizobium mesosinicum]|uniref:Copper chaperone PCu(A)C n=1 Tax=Rhizobium mesosinicum TaxID=335017 RepID=A0ABS7GZ39_9HYPH|nr:copper uptake system-associated protein [Rhizobium mesosinicum]MBW9054806.1 copper chaperone PCu(A)C [Rhizobium mesosinicum]